MTKSPQALTFEVRQRALCDLIHSEKGDALLITHLPHIRYLTGFCGSTAFLLALRDQTYAFITDFRYKEQAQKEIAQCPNVQFVLVEKEYLVTLSQVLLGRKISVLLFQSKSLTCYQFSMLKKLVPSLNLMPTTDACEKIVRKKDAWEVEAISQAAAISDQLFDMVPGLLKEGTSEKMISANMEYQGMLKGSEGPAFPSIIASGENASLPHARSSAKKPKKGEMVLFDYGSMVNGFCSDMSRTVSVGRASAKLKEVYGIVLEAQTNALKAIRPGTACAAVDKIARDIITKAGYGDKFGHGLGHSLGLEIHEEPRLSAASKDVLQEGMLMTVEPGIYLPGWGGVRIEDLVVVTKESYINLTHSPKELMEIEI